MTRPRAFRIDRRAAARDAGILLAFLALAIFWTWPVAAHLTSRVAHDAGDPLLNIWILWWNAHALPLTDAWWNAPMMWPMPGAMALSEHLLGLSVVATPLQLLGATPVAAYNTCLVLTYALSGFFTFVLVRRLTGSVAAGVCAGLAFGFSPYRAGQLAHIQVLSAQWMPLALLGMHAHLSSGRTRWLVLFAAAWLLQALSNGYYLLFFPVLIALWIVWFVDWRRQPRRGVVLAGTFAIASAALLPILLQYHAIHARFGLRRAVSDIRQFSATLSSFLQPAPLLQSWRDGAAANNELYLFPGVAVVVVALAGVILRLRKRERSESKAAVFYVGAALVMAALALGPGGDGESASPARPYSWLLLLPGFDGIRAPARFTMIASLCLAIAAGFAVAQLESAVRRARVRVTAVSLVIAALLVDGLTAAVPVVVPPSRIAVPHSGPPPAVLELPLDSADVTIAAMYRAMFHGLPLVNGYSGHVPAHYSILTLALARGDASVLAPLAAQRPLVVVVNGQRDAGHEYRRMVEAIAGIQSLGVGTGGSMYLLPAATPQTRSPGPIVPSTARSAGRQLLELDLGTAHRLSSLEFALRHRYPSLAPRIRVETSDDGQTWNEVWLGWTGGLALEGALTDPGLVPVRIPLPAASARYVRVYPAPDWMLNELTARSE